MVKAMIDTSKKPPMLSKLVALATQRKSREKATLATMIRIVEKYGSLETALEFVGENEEPDFPKMVGVITILCQQENPDITEETVKQNIDMSNIADAIALTREWINLELPESVRNQIEEATIVQENSKVREGAKPKNQKAKAQTK